MPPSIFLDFRLPNSATWFYLSLFLAVALFFQFGRVFTVRNLDLLALFLFVPGFLLVQEANALTAGGAAGDRADRERFVGYAWLLGASAFWFVRALADLAGGKRPLVNPNLSPAGLAWFGGSLFVCLTAVAFARPADPWEPVGKRPAALTGVQDGAAAVVFRTPSGGTPAEARFLVERAFTVGCHLAVVVGLVLVGSYRFGDPPTGVAAGTLYLLAPYTAYHIGQVHHVWPAALILWAVYMFRFPLVAGVLVGLAAGTAFFPVLLLPVWGQFYRAHGAGRFVGGAAAAGAAGLAGTLAVLYAAGQFPDGVWRTLNLADWQPWQRPTAESIWTGAHWAYRLPVFILYAGFVLLSFVWPPVRNLGHLIAASVAVLIGVQFWFADRGGLYVLWYAPLLVLMVLRPNLSEAVPGVPRPWPAFLVRVGTWATTVGRPAKPAEPAPVAA